MTKKEKTEKKTGRPVEWTPERLEKERLLLEEWMKKDSHISLTDFANSRGYHLEWLTKLSRKTESFGCSYKKAKRLCAERIAHGAYSGKKNAAVAIFMLKCNHGWIEENEKQKIAIKKKELQLKEKLAEKGIGDGGSINVYLDNIPQSKDVPHKEDS